MTQCHHIIILEKYCIEREQLFACATDKIIIKLEENRYSYSEDSNTESDGPCLEFVSEASNLFYFCTTLVWMEEQKLSFMLIHMCCVYVFNYIFL